MRTRRGREPCFTLVELLIVVIILGILAAVVIPQFSDASTDARSVALQQNLAIIRKQIELYKLQHVGNYPTDEGKFEDEMTMKTNPDRTTSGTPTLGPYLHRIPDNPFTTGSDTNKVESTGAGPDKAWFYDKNTGEFRANDGGSTDGVPHASL